jgi:hypothetical protein
MRCVLTRERSTKDDGLAALLIASRATMFASKRSRTVVESIHFKDAERPAVMDMPVVPTNLAGNFGNIFQITPRLHKSY